MRVTYYESDKAADAANLWADGWYPAQIQTAEEAKTKKGDPMLVMTVNVWGEGSNPRPMKDWLTDHPANGKRIRHLVTATNLEEEYRQGRLPAELLEGKQLMVEIGSREGQDGGMFNCIKDYGPADKAKMVKQSASANSTIDDADIPFSPFPDGAYPWVA